MVNFFLVCFLLQIYILQFWLVLFILSSSLLRFSVGSLILLPSLVSILIINALNSLFHKLFAYFIRFFPQVFFPCSFIWNKFLCFFSFCSVKLGEIFACPSFEEVSLWGSILILCMCLLVLVGGLDLKWAQVTSFPRLSQAWSRASPLLSGQHHTNGDEGGSQVAGSETMRFESELVLFTLSVSSSLAHLPKREAGLEQEVAEWASCYVPRCWLG